VTFWDVNYLEPISDQFPKRLTFSEFSRVNREKFLTAHINCNNLQQHSKEMRIKFEDSCVDVVGVTIHRSLNTSVVYHSLDDYGLQAL
jgi:hypothetical protein